MTTSHIGHGTTATLQPGAAVLSSDGKPLGTVKEAHYDRFLVNARWAPDYWLGTETIDSSSDNQVQLILTKNAIGAAKLRNEVTGPGLGRDAEDFNGPAPADRPTQSL